MFVNLVFDRFARSIENRRFILSSLKIYSVLVEQCRLQKFGALFMSTTPPVDPDAPKKPPTDKTDLQTKEVALSCSGCGFLGTYHFGVMIAFQKNGKDLLSRVTRFAGASAGSLIATLMVLAPDKLEDGLNQMYEMADELHALRLGALTPGYFLSEQSIDIFPMTFPKPTIVCSFRLQDKKDKTNRIVSKFSSREYLALCLNASCFIPIYSSGYYAIPPVIDQEPCIDGGYTNNLPVFDDMQTITISPFSGSAIIAPQDENRFEWQLTLGTQIMKINMQNLTRGAHSLFPPTRTVLKAYYEMGFRDGLKFLMDNDLLEREEGTEV
ncbi:Patatin-like phospholipase domain-containing protein 4 [Aphelenchoides besseyi]|nr:Patatin-like phospholipase domain-containing protein 4 [Aphelenchoides besseyi]